MGLTLGQVSKMADVSVAWISMVERAKRHPGPARLARLRDALGIIDPLPGLYAVHIDTADLVAHLGAILSAVPSLPLKTMAKALNLPVGEIRRGLTELDRRLSECGIRVLDDGVEAQLSPARELNQLVATVTGAAKPGALTRVQTVVLAVVIAHGMATRRQVDEVRGADSAEALSKLVERGWLAYDIDEESAGHPIVYRPTPYLLQRFGARSVEELQAILREKAAATPGVTSERFEDLFGGPLVEDVDAGADPI